ncbi:hypothetical protein JX266_005612 [Neoarthrinium moseri]|nr:hypothetical protein JX266_005612 [Neoarthrinium moseri]
MRLMDVHTLRLVNIFSPQTITYTILSHTWGADEVSFQEWEQVNPSGAIKSQCPHSHKSDYAQEIKKKSGYQKIVGACEQARRDGFQYLWCDTNCINKESSAELSEAINSMFAWYRDSAICYAYLEDIVVPLKLFQHRRGQDEWFIKNPDDPVALARQQFQQSRWWTRGWTLQEVLAPAKAEFFSADWTSLGQRRELSGWISKFTTIHEEALKNRDSIWSFSIAQRMSWASERNTTVVEDTAYCLLGIFNISMPLLYGAGERAFRTLQEEIIKSSDDQSIFAWQPTRALTQITRSDVLASSPISFQLCGSIICDLELPKIPYSLSNSGLRMVTSLIPSGERGPCYIGLNCSMDLRGKTRRYSKKYLAIRRLQVWIVVRKIGRTTFERVHLPQSIMHLEESYACVRSLKPAELFITTADQKRSLRRGAGSLLDLEAGIRVSIGFGNLREATQTYVETLDPLDFTVDTVGMRKSFAQSHTIIEGGSFVVILSVVWGHDSEPERQLHTILHDPKQELRRDLYSLISQEYPTQNSARGDLRCPHQQLRETLIGAVVAGGEKHEPLVLMEDEPFLDIRSRAVVVAEIIFREQRVEYPRRK